MNQGVSIRHDGAEFYFLPDEKLTPEIKEIIEQVVYSLNKRGT